MGVPMHSEGFAKFRWFGNENVFLVCFSEFWWNGIENSLRVTAPFSQLHARLLEESAELLLEIDELRHQ